MLHLRPTMELRHDSVPPTSQQLAMRRSEASRSVPQICYDDLQSSEYLCQTPVEPDACLNAHPISLNDHVHSSQLAWRRISKDNGNRSTRLADVKRNVQQDIGPLPYLPIPMHRIASGGATHAVSSAGFGHMVGTRIASSMDQPPTITHEQIMNSSYAREPSSANNRSAEIRSGEPTATSVPSRQSAPSANGIPAKPATHKIPAARMSIWQKLPVPLPEPRFLPSADKRPKSRFVLLPQGIRSQIWTWVVRGYELESFVVKDEITFIASGSISGLPARYTQPQAIIRLVNKYTISKSCYQDASAAFFTHVLPFLVSKVCTWEEYEMLEKYVLRGCPSHFVRFSLDFQLFTGPKSAIHQIEMRSMINFMSCTALATKGSVRIDDSMRDKLQQDGFFVEDKSKPHNQLLTLRRAPEQVVSQLTVDGPIGNIYWWVHSFNDYMLTNRMHWKRMPALMADFSAQMRYWIRRHGIAYSGTARFGCLLVAWRECCFDAEQNQSVQMAWSIVKGWKDLMYI